MRMHMHCAAPCLLHSLVRPAAVLHTGCCAVCCVVCCAHLEGGVPPPGQLCAAIIAAGGLNGGYMQENTLRMQAVTAADESAHEGDILDARCTA